MQNITEKETVNLFITEIKKQERKKMNIIYIPTIAILIIILLSQNISIGWKHSLPKNTIKTSQPRKSEVSKAKIVSIRENANLGYPDKVKWALKSSARTILSYEVSNGKQGDREIVLTAWANRLNDSYNKCNSCTSYELLDNIGKKWNPNKHKSYKQIKQIASTRLISNKIATKTLRNILIQKYDTKEGKLAGNINIRHFAHLDEAPSYYNNLDNTRYLSSSNTLRNRVWIGS